MNPFINSILTGIKSIFGMPHDATEAEVDAKLQSVKTHEQLTAQIRAEIMADRSGDEEFLKIKADLDTAQAELTRLKADFQTAHDQTTQATGEKTALETELATAKSEIARLEKLPAAQHTNGDDAPPGDAGQSKKIWHDSPANVSARLKANGYKMNFPKPN